MIDEEERIEDDEKRNNFIWKFFGLIFGKKIEKKSQRELQKEKKEEREGAHEARQWRSTWTKKRSGNVQSTPRSAGGVVSALSVSVNASPLYVPTALECAPVPAAPPLPPPPPPSHDSPPAEAETQTPLESAPLVASPISSTANLLSGARDLSRFHSCAPGRGSSEMIWRTGGLRIRRIGANRRSGRFSRVRRSRNPKKP